MIGTQNITPDKPKYNDTFSVDLLHQYLSQLIRQGYITEDLENYEGEVDYVEAFDAFNTHCPRLKEPLFLLSLLDDKYELLIQMAQHNVDTAETDYARAKSQELVDEWNMLYDKVGERELNDKVMSDCLPYRYARLSQHAKSWKYRKELSKWKQTYGVMGSLSDILSEEQEELKQQRQRNKELREKNMQKRMKK